MKIALLFSGQYRSVPPEIFQNSLSTLVEGIDYSIYSYCWEEKGNSMNHSISVPVVKKTNISNDIETIFKPFNLKDYSFESFSKFKKNLPAKYKRILNSKRFHFGTIHSLPQIYSIFKCYELFKSDLNNEEYDLIFRCRYDSVFIHPLILFPLKSILNSDNLYNINFGRAYYPQRVYDIFFGGSKKSMSFISSIWDDLPNLIDNSFDNNLDKRDACRILFLAPNLKNIKVKTFNSRICDVFRNANDYGFEKYIIYSHIINIFKIRNLSVLKYFSDHLISRKISIVKIIFYILITLFLTPFSYIKRIKYIFNCKNF